MSSSPKCFTSSRKSRPVPGISDGPDSRVSQTLVPFIVELLCHGYAIVSPREQPEYERSVVEAVNAGVKLLSA